MTMPHLMNCNHIADGWCLDCVGEQHAELERLRAQVPPAGEWRGIPISERLDNLMHAAKWDADEVPNLKANLLADVNAMLAAAPAQQADHTALLRMLARRARCFPGFPLGYHIPEVFAALGEAPPQPAEPPAQQAEPVTEVVNDYNADGRSSRISEYLPAGTKLYAALPSHQPAQGMGLTDEQCDQAAAQAMDRVAAAHDMHAVHLNPNVMEHATLRRALIRAGAALAQAPAAGSAA